jgi:hypothetical protein
MTTKSTNDHFLDALRYGYTTPQEIARDKLCELLTKLGIKSADRFMGTVRVESLDLVLDNVTFDVKDLKLWSPIKKP